MLKYNYVINNLDYFLFTTIICVYPNQGRR